MKGTMTKMEAVHALMEIKIDIEGQLSNLRERAETLKEKDESDIERIQTSRWMDKQEKEFERNIRALEMAGTAMTR